tara:strand:- start:420 stop:2114 length:1695 start_codon:yes stop_codon:yes gene_type:complete
MILSGFSEIISLVSVVPFLTALTNPQKIWNIKIVQILSKSIGLLSPGDLLLPTTLLFALATIVAAAIRLTNLWVYGRLAAAIGSDLSCNSYRDTLNKPYGILIQENSSDIISKTTNDVTATVIVINLSLQMATSFVVISSLLAGLILVNWKVSIFASAVFSFSYLFLAYFSRKRLLQNSFVVANSYKAQIRSLQEGLGAIRDVILDSRQETYISIFKKADKPIRFKQAENNFLAAFPKYALEALGILSLAAIAYVLTLTNNQSSNIIPTIGTIGLGAQRLLPAMQQTYSAWATIKSNNTALQRVITSLENPHKATNYSLSNSKANLFNHSIKFSSISYKYNNNTKYILKDLNLEIKKGERIGLIGKTGCGKSTLIDLLMGLLEPTDGKILIDNKELCCTNNSLDLLRWRRLISHVPQSIYLSDKTIAENIAFGVEQDCIDFERVELAANLARISEFIEQSKDGYASYVGERGVSLSGGQKQRIGIARALYKEAEILVFDEATSALDNSTEKEMMNSIYKLGSNLTIIMIAHRLSTISKCDRVLLLENGKIKKHGPPIDVLGNTN